MDETHLVNDVSKVVAVAKVTDLLFLFCPFQACDISANTARHVGYVEKGPK